MRWTWPSCQPSRERAAFAHQLGLEHWYGFGAIEQAHQTQRGIGHFGVGLADPHRIVTDLPHGLHLPGDVRDHRGVEFENQRVVRDGNASARNLTDGGHIGSNEQRVPGGEIVGLRPHSHAFCSLQDKADERPRDVVRETARRGRAHGEEAADGHERDACVIGMCVRMTANEVEQASHATIISRSNHVRIPF